MSDADRQAFRLDGQRALITGSARGLGFAIAEGLAAAGASVWINGRTVNDVNAAVARIRERGGRAQAATFDVTDYQAFAALLNRVGAFEILVNNVGIRDRRSLAEFDLADVRHLLEVDLLAPFELSRTAAAKMSDGGRIVNITSIAGPISAAADSVYTMAKGGLDALTRALAAELGPDGINVNAVAPGYFATERNARLAADPQIEAWLGRRTALGRWGRPEEIAGAVVFLCSAAASYVTGHTLAVDGGYLAHF